MDNSSKSKKKIKKRATGDPLPPKQGLFAQLTSENSVRPKKRTRQPSISESSEVYFNNNNNELSRKVH